ncbi:MAG: heat-inducible transcriptional repressor HrcA [Rhodospirillales bacterium]|nr:heat-inducible transcriptional repressor HrcA [Alphaproteobacteria bacterium]MBL6928809.1 heat-inducible transcriptional repressor HrcA [Rhodospirillales bacterium]
MITELNERSRDIFRHIVDAYMETGDPVGSRTVSKLLDTSLSPATIRNVMADLEDSGLLFSPHASAGRLPTEAGLKLFVDGLLEVGNLTAEERHDIEGGCVGSGQSVDGLMEQISQTLSGLSGCAGLVLAPKTSSPLRHIEFVYLSPGRALVVLVAENGVVENRVIETPPTLLPSALVEATNYLSARMVGRTLSGAYEEIIAELEAHNAELDQLTGRVVEAGLATWAGQESERRLIVRGRANLLDDVTAAADLERIRGLFNALETKDTMLKMISLADTAEGVQIFIGSDSQLFGMSGCSMIVGSYQNSQNHVLGAIGVIGPTRMDYARIIPMVDFTAKLIGRIIG